MFLVILLLRLLLNKHFKLKKKLPCEYISSHAIGQALSSTVLLAARSAVTHHLAVNGEALVGRRM